jgi:hypothetical protein
VLFRLVYLLMVQLFGWLALLTRSDVLPQQTVARWQHRLIPLQRRVFGGCHINRPIDRLVVDAGLELTRLDNYYLKGPRAFCSDWMAGSVIRWRVPVARDPGGANGERATAPGLATGAAARRRHRRLPGRGSQDGPAVAERAYALPAQPGRDRRARRRG